MIVLDTNVLSELLKLRPNPGVLSWFAALRIAETMTTVVTAAELRFGVEKLPSGQRKAALRLAINGLLDEDFSERVLPFTVAATVPFAELTCAREHSGRPIGLADAQIAAICRVHDATLATRNVRDFEDCGIAMINPWAN